MQVEIDGKTTSIRPEVERAKRDVARRIRSRFKRRWGEGRHVSRIIVVGGGGQALETELKKEFPEKKLWFAEDAEMANARGFMKFGIQ